MKAVLPFLFFIFIIAAFLSCQNEQEIEYNRYFTAGKVVYQSHCQNCHGADGAGLGTLIPPLTDAAYLKKIRTQQACIITYGLQQPVLVGRKAYYQKMPPSGLAPVDVAEVITYVNNSFGNKSGSYPIEQVTADLKQCN